MDLSEDQCQEFEDRGWLVVGDVFSEKELDLLTNAALQVLDRPGPEVGREADGSPHVSWGMHLFNEKLALLCRHENLINPSRSLLGEEVYVHQSRINMKQTNGSIVAWHQDFGTYHRVDGVPEAKGIMIAVFLDDVTEVNAPLLAVPGSHKEGLVSTASIDPSSAASVHNSIARGISFANPGSPWKYFSPRSSIAVTSPLPTRFRIIAREDALTAGKGVRQNRAFVKQSSLLCRQFAALALPIHAANAHYRV